MFVYYPVILSISVDFKAENNMEIFLYIQILECLILIYYVW